MHSLMMMTTIEFIESSSSSSSSSSTEDLNDNKAHGDDDDDDNEDKAKKKKRRRTVVATTATRPAALAMRIRTSSPLSPAPPPPPQTAQLWTDAFAATTSSDLAVHAKKVAAVRLWLESTRRTASTTATATASMMHPRVLCLTGPPGAGKSATVRALARDLNLDLHEWHAAPVVRKINASLLDPDHSDVDDALLAPLARWLNDHAAFRSLLATSPAAHKLLLIDELPYLHSDRERAAFRALVDRFCRAARFPLVIVLTDSVALRVRDLLPAYDNDALPLATIAFNATPPTLLRKALLRVLARAGVADVPDALVDHVAEQCQGDVRHAVNTLQMMCVGHRRLPRATAGMPPPPTRPNKRKKTPLAARHGNGASSAATAMTTATGAAAAAAAGLSDPFVLTIGRDETVSLFRALGKVLIGKREDSSGASESKSRPMSVTFLDGNARRRSRNADGRPPLAFDPEELLLATNMDANMFALFLFENYVPYVDSVLAEDRSIEAAAGAADWLSLSAQVGAVWDSEAHGDIAHQYAGSLAVRGIVHENWFPEPATAPPARSAFRPQHRPHWLHVRSVQQTCAAALRAASLAPAAAPLAPPRSAVANVGTEVALDRVPWLHRIVTYVLSGAPAMRNRLAVPDNVRALCRAVCNYAPAVRRAAALQQNELAEASGDDGDEQPSGGGGGGGEHLAADEAMRVFEQWAGLARRAAHDADADNAPLSAEEVRQQIELLKLDPIVD